MVLILAGAVVGLVTHDALAETLNTDTAQPFVEIILAVLLFIDATDVRGGLFGRDPRSALRVLLIALPLSLGLSVALGLWLLPGCRGRSYPSSPTSSASPYTATASFRPSSAASPTADCAVPSTSAVTSVSSTMRGSS